MKIQLLKGHFEAADALQIIGSLIDCKIKYHEGKIDKLTQEEDIKMRENRIIQLQNDFEKIRNYVASVKNGLDLEAEIEILAT